MDFRPPPRGPQPESLDLESLFNLYAGLEQAKREETSNKLALGFNPSGVTDRDLEAASAAPRVGESQVIGKIREFYARRQGGMKPSERANTEGKLFDDLMNSPTTKQFRAVRDTTRNVHALSTRKGGVFDVANLYSFVKALDPESVVREGEISLSQRAMPGLDRIALLYNNMAKGRLTSDAFNAEVRSAIGDLYQEKEKGYLTERETIASRARQYPGLDPDVFIPSLQLTQDEKDRFFNTGGTIQGPPPLTGGKIGDHPAATPMTETGGTKIRVRTKDGKVWEIPPSKLNLALSRGATKL